MENFAQVRRAECEVGKVPRGAVLPKNSRTIVWQSVLNEVIEHGRSSLQAEVCGVLVGRLCWENGKGAYLCIDGRIEGRYAEHQAGSVTFTSETWDYIHQQLEKKFPKHRIVGWYHTHPGFGIFLSEMDVFIHRNFFGSPWQPALVYDPLAEKEGFFFWSGDNVKPKKIGIYEDVAPIRPYTGNMLEEPEKESVIVEDVVRDTSSSSSERLRGILEVLLIVLLLLSLGGNVCQYLQLKQKNKQPKVMHVVVEGARQPARQVKVESIQAEVKPEEAKPTEGKPEKKPSAKNPAK